MTEAAAVPMPLRQQVGVALRGLSASVTYGASRIIGLPAAAERLRWVLVATLPNSGSTALAQLLASSPEVSLLTGNGEGQWLLPDLSRPVERWRTEAPVNYARLRHVWTRAALRGDGGVVVEKSPSNLVRLPGLVAALGGAERVSVICLTRDPLAICASWVRRYSREAVASQWLGRAPAGWEDDQVFHEVLGDLCGQRMALLAERARTARLTISYEEVTGQTAQAAGRLRAALPEVGAIDPGAAVSVKDYAAQPLRDMNTEQLARLTDDQAAAIRRGLAPHRAAIAALGYSQGGAA